MSDNVILFPSIFEQKSFIDLKEASLMTGLRYPLLYKIVVSNNEIGYCRIGRKILLQVSDVQEYIAQHYIKAGSRK